MTSPKEIRRLLRLVEGQGCTTTKNKKNHWKVRLPDGSLVTFPGTPSDHRSMANAVALLRRKGLEIPSRGW